jgi:hypothetical protein
MQFGQHEGTALLCFDGGHHWLQHNHANKPKQAAGIDCAIW